MEPESNQTSITSGTRFKYPFPFSDLNASLSTRGLCGSKFFASASEKIFPVGFPLSSSHSAPIRSVYLPTPFNSSPSSLTQIGNGVPQNLSREIPQSFRSSSQLPKRP